MDDKPMWDVEEVKDYIVVDSLIYKTKYNIIAQYKNKKHAVIILSMVDKLIRQIVNTVKRNFNSIPKELKGGFKVFLDIHPNKQELFELPINSIFIGLNKPKNVKPNDRLPSVGKDGLLKAKKRYIFLKLRNNNGTFIDLDDIAETVIHEIVHTVANHVIWRDDDHGPDYKAYYNYLKSLI